MSENNDLLGHKFVLGRTRDEEPMCPTNGKARQ